MSSRARKILVGYSGSAAARRALDAAVGQMGYGSLLAVACVANPGEAGASLALSEAREHLLHRHLSATYLPLEGAAGEELVDTASALGADLVVVGACERNGSSARELGPVSAEVVRRAPCDVLVVR